VCDVRARMLENFPVEVPVARTETKAAELVGFAPEEPAVPPPTSTRTTWDWRRSAWPTAVLWMGWVCAAVTLGAVAARSGSAAEPPARVSVLKHISVFMPTTPVLITTPSDATTVAARRASSVKEPARQPVRVATVKEPARQPVVRVAAKREVPPPRRPVAATPSRQPADVIVRSEIRPPQLQPMAPGIPAPAIPRQPHLQPIPAASPAPSAPPVVPPQQPLAVAATAGVVSRASEEAAVRAVLEQYRGAYERLDAGAAQRIWPGVDERRLARAFSDLESQTLAFEQCRVDVTNRRGTARCRGRATYVGRVGTRVPQTHVRDWTFQLWKAGDSWAIESIRSQ
jgi:hypothetical protein